MAFRKLIDENRRLPLVSLIDLIFILLIFFIITSVMIKLSKGESKLYIPTPKNEPGEAQILIQIVDEDDFLWIDHTAIDTLRIMQYRSGRTLEVKTKVSLLVQKMRVNKLELFSRLDELASRSRGSLSKEYFVLIRCPNEVPYHYATSLIEKLVGNPYVQYGCISGSIQDILASRNLYIKDNVLQIDF